MNVGMQLNTENGYPSRFICATKLHFWVGRGRTYMFRNLIIGMGINGECGARFQCGSFIQSFARHRHYACDFFIAIARVLT